MSKKVAVILSGCGVYDGTEVTEAVSTFVALEKVGLDFETFAPDVNKAHVVDHATGEEQDETRNVLVESNRISRGTTKALSLLNCDSFDALLIVGGFGAAKNLSDFAFKGADLSVNANLNDILTTFNAQGKWILALCIAPVLLAKTLQARVTIGSDAVTSDAIVNIGGKHENTTVSEYCIDEECKVITTPAFMLAENYASAFDGIHNAVVALNEKL